MDSRRKHYDKVLAYLRQNLGGLWELTIPGGTGHETYSAQSGSQACFIKLGARVELYQVAAAHGLSPPVLNTGSLADGTPILIQQYIAGRTPSRADYQALLEQFARAIQTLHNNPELKQLLPQPTTEQYRDAGLAALNSLREKWAQYRSQVPGSVQLVEAGLSTLADQIHACQGSGLAASHGDICNANWLITPTSELYLVDLDALSLDDPALDLGATLWWYYPPELRSRFLAAAGYPDSPGLRQRMRVRMALHCLSILLPRPGSFDRFDPHAFADRLVDFRAALAGKENPQGYSD